MTMNSIRDQLLFWMTDTEHMLLPIASMFLMPGKLHVLRKDKTAGDTSVMAKHIFDFRIT